MKDNAAVTFESFVSMGTTFLVLYLPCKGPLQKHNKKLKLKWKGDLKETRKPLWHVRCLPLKLQYTYIYTLVDYKV